MIRFEGGSCSINASGGDHGFSLDIVPYRGDALTEIEPLVFNLVAVIDVQELPAIISTDWVVSKVKKICHVVGFSCEGFEKQMLALFTE